MVNFKGPTGLWSLRYALGLMWLAHAGLKYLVYGVAGTAAFLESQHLPSAMAWPLILAELLLAVVLVSGWYVRQFALLGGLILAGACWVHWPLGWVFTAQGGGWEYPALLLFLHVLLWMLPDVGYHLRTSTKLTLSQGAAHEL